MDSPTSPTGRGGWRGRGFRGGDRGGTPRGRGAGWNPGFRPRPEFSPLLSKEATPPRGKLIESIHREKLSSDVDPEARITSSELVATFNWLGGTDKPTILVPGMPALWTPPNEPHPLKQDSGVFYRDKNAVRFPSHPWEPAARAVIESRPHGGDVDIVCCGSTLGNLLRFVRGTDRPFQFLVDVVGGAVHFTRRENKPDETMQDVKGYGHTFPDAYTTWPASVAVSVSHQRIVRYMFAGFAVMLRFESDGYIDAGDRLQMPEKDAAVDDITSLLESSLGPVSQDLPKVKAPLEVRRGGVMIPQNKVFDVKTRGLWRKDVLRLLEDELPRLWVSQTPNLITAYHQNGKFPTQHIDVRDTREDIARFERDHAKEISTLAALLRSIVTFAQKHKHIEVTRDAQGVTIELREQVDGSGVVFSDDVRDRWEEWLGGDHGSTPLDDGPPEEEEYKGIVADTPNAAGVDWDDGEDDYSKCSAGCGYCGVAAAHL